MLKVLREIGVRRETFIVKLKHRRRNKEKFLTEENTGLTFMNRSMAVLAVWEADSGNGTMGWHL